MSSRLEYIYDHRCSPKDDLLKIFNRFGFVVIRNHGVSFKNLENLYLDWEDFFINHDKKDFPFNNDIPSGYAPYKLKGKDVYDTKECFYFRPKDPSPSHLYYGTCVVFDILYEFATIILDIILHGINIQRSVGEKNIYSGMLKIIRYHPLHGLLGANFVQKLPFERLPTHCDLNLLTIQPPSTSKGLEIMNKNGAWQNVYSCGEDIIVNAGNELEELTCGIIKSTPHRVVVREINEAVNYRFSSPFFLGK